MLKQEQRIKTKSAGPVILTKLQIGQPGDKYEQEADAVANRVMKMSESDTLQMQPVEEEEEMIQPKLRMQPVEEEEELIQPKIQMQAEEEEELIQMKCEECENEEMLQAKIRMQPEEEEELLQPMRHTHPAEKNEMQLNYAGSPSIPDDMSANLIKSGNSGQQLPDSTQTFMSEAFGSDFSHVKVHTNSEAIHMNRQLRAKAFTHGINIYFNSGKYNPDSSTGKRLLAHELTHTIQQGKGRVSSGKNYGPSQGIRGISEDESLPIQTISSSSDQHKIQRVASWAAGPVHETVNLAPFMLGLSSSPVTWPTLNGTQFWSGAATAAALKSPTISTQKSGKTYEAKVTSVDTNAGSFDETVLTKAPWSTVVPKTTVNAQYPIAACTGKGNTTFRAKGDPSDNDVGVANRRHEDHHANDHKTSFNNTLKKWDTKLTNAKTNGSAYAGNSAADATTNLWTAMGGTPTQVSNSFFNACQAAVIAYHGSPKGGPFGTSGSGSDKTCSTSWLKVTNPS